MLETGKGKNSCGARFIKDQQFLCKMELKILEEKKNKLILEIKGEGHTFLNALKNELLKNKHVKIASYNISHPIVGVPKIILETDGEAPKKVLQDAAKKMSERAEDFKKLVSSSIKW